AMFAWLAMPYPLPIPTMSNSIVTGHVVVFLLLAPHGPYAAAVAAGMEALIGSKRTTPRLSSHIASLSGGAAAMLVAGTLFVAAQPWLRATGLPASASHLAALALAALVYLVVSTCALMQIVCLKRGTRLTFDDWFGSVSWVGTLYLVAAVLAGMLSLNA